MVWWVPPRPFWVPRWSWFFFKAFGAFFSVRSAELFYFDHKLSGSFGTPGGGVRVVPRGHPPRFNKDSGAGCSACFFPLFLFLMTGSAFAVHLEYPWLLLQIFASVPMVVVLFLPISFEFGFVVRQIV